MCSDLPAHHFLKQGATYVLLGSIPSPQHHNEVSEWSYNVDVVRTKLDSATSSLYRKLCGAVDGKCRYAPKVILDANLNCVGIECEIQAPRVVEVEPGIYYEYLRLPCAMQTFFPNGRAVKERHISYSCADPRQQTGKHGIPWSISVLL